MSTPPPGGRAGIGEVGAVRAGANGPAEVLAQRGMMVGDPCDGVAHGAGHTGSSALGRGRRSSIATAQPDGARELSEQEVAFGIGLGGPFAVPGGPRLVDVLVDLGETPTVRLLGPGVEHRTGVARTRTGQA